MKKLVPRLTLTLLLSLSLNAPLFAQTNAPIREENVRAALSFLASDALQGRGSGTIYERIAAEYVGSQFRQFGLEPGGDDNGYVQRVPLEATKFTEPPTLSVTSGADTQKWQHGRDFFVPFLTSARIAGDLQVVEPTASFTKDAVVAVKLPNGATQDQRREVMMRARTSNVAAIVLTETEAGRATREAGNAPLPQVPPQIGGAASRQAFAVISIKKEVFDVLAAMPSGAKVEFGGTIQAGGESATWNAIGFLKGSDPQAASEVILLSAHLDHLGVNETLTGDKIFNGADDDASGVVAVMEMARVLSTGKRPRRTVYFVCFGSEERGGFGSQYFVSNPPVPLTQIVANVTFEMLGRPDPKIAAGALWLTGFERSNLGSELAKQGASIVADPHPEQRFFQRSDNYTLALRGVIAHTVSSFGLHTDYHRPSDEVSKIDFPFMTQSLNSLVKSVQWLVNSTFRPAWHPGQAPTR